MSYPKVRFAPSPTGLIHIGNARTALVNWLFARQAKGKFVLRIDDTDLERSLAEYETAIENDLAWLGLDWDEKFNQSDRNDRYSEIAGRLKEDGRLYPCYETAEELDYKRKRQMSRGQPPIYDRASLKLSQKEIDHYLTEGRRPHWRFRLEEGEIHWHDLVRGPCTWQAENLSDPVLIRGDGTVLYTLPSVIDDIDHAITHIIRGEDHVTNTATQIQIFAALGASIPQFAHLPLISDKDGQGLSKRLGSLSIQELREADIEPMAINSLLGRLGTSDVIHPFAEMNELVLNFNLNHFGRATPKFDNALLDHLNSRLLHELPAEKVITRLSAMNIPADEIFWLTIRANLNKLTDARDWWQICREPLTPIIEDASFTSLAAGLLPDEPWSDETWNVWTKQISSATGRKGKMLFHPLRMALTGRENGPELKKILPLIGYKKSSERLNGLTA